MRTYTAWSVAGTFHAGKSAYLAEVSVINEQILQKFPKYTEIFGKLSMRSVYQGFFSPPTHESLGTMLIRGMLKLAEMYFMFDPLFEVVCRRSLSHMGKAIVEGITCSFT